MNLEHHNFNNKERIPRGEILVFKHSENENVYNPSRPFIFEGRKYIIARVENVIQKSSTIHPFVFVNGIWERVNWPLGNFELEDPAITFIDNQLILIAVRVLDKSSHNNWLIQTEFYRGETLNKLNKFAEGPIGMKDIRLVGINKNKIGIFTRPKGREFKKGRICYLEIENLDELEVIKNNPGKLIELPISEKEWIGANDAYYLGSDYIGVLAHKAFRDRNKNLHYQAIAFVLNRLNLQISNFKIITSKDDFPPSKIKSDKHYDIIFPGGFEFFNNKALLYCGISDAQVGIIEISNPYSFL